MSAESIPQPRTKEALMSALKPYAVEDRKKSWSLTLTTLALIALSVRLTLPDLPLAIRIFASIMTALTMSRSFILYHDFMHGAIFRDSRLGGAMMSFVGTMMLRPPADWRRSHNFHHAHNTQFATASVGSFPIKTVDEYAACTESQKRTYRIIRSPLVIVFGYITCFVLESFKKLFFREDGLSKQALITLTLHFTLMYICAQRGWDVLVLTFLFPYFASCGIGTYLFYIQHNFEGARFRPDAEWDFEFAALNSSSCLRCSPISHWFSGNIGYHHIHHLNHKIPFYRLPEAMKAIPELQHPTFVDLKIGTILRTLSLKLWDPRQSKLITFKEFELGLQVPSTGTHISAAPILTKPPLLNSQVR
jgi:omega-6 fatty acid desaturase (delta-12 desaturase)